MTVMTMSQLAESYNISRVLIHKTIADNPEFPYTPPPPENVRWGYRFDSAEVDKWLLTHEWARGNPAYHPEIRERLDQERMEKRQKQIAAGITPDDSEATKNIRNKRNGKTNKNEVQTALLQLELDKRRGRLVDRDDVINELSPVVAALAKQIEMWPNQIGKKLGFSDEAIRTFRDHVDEARATFLRNALAGVLNPEFVIEEIPDDE